MLPNLRNRGFFPSWVDEFFGEGLWPNMEGHRNRTMPAVNITEEANQFIIEVASPGMTKKDFNIELEENVLTISSEREEHKEERKKKFLRKEYNYTSFKRSFTLPGTVREEDIKASYREGILHITIPKKEETTTRLSRKIDIT